MLVGHFAVAFTAKAFKPEISLGTFVFAAMLPDLLWPLFTIAGIEYISSGQGIFDAVMSHSLLMVMLWGLVFAAAYYFQRRDRTGAWILLLVVCSHWILDVISHKHVLMPGLKLYVGLGLWKSFVATILIEGGFWLISILLYVRSTRAKHLAGVLAFWPAVAFLTFVWVTNIRLGPPPPDKILGSFIFFTLLVLWAYWMNRLRPSKKAPAS